MTDIKPSLAHILVDCKGKYPHKLAEKYPHIVKHMAEIWDDPAAISEYFNELLIPQRSDRQGFSHDIATEVFSLSLAYDMMHLRKVEGPPDAKEIERSTVALEQQGVARTMLNFARAVESGDRELCMLFLRSGFDVDSRDVRHWTPLMIAAFNGNEAVALMLIQQGASIGAEDRGGYTPLHWAAYNGFVDVVKLLISEGAEPNVLSHSGITPILQAAARGRLEVVGELLKAWANPNIAAHDGTTPLLKAVANGHLEVVKLLLEAGALVNVTMSDGTTLMSVARSSKDPEIRQRIWEAAKALK